MIVTTPPLSIKKLNVFAALFKAQFPDTLSALRAALKEWNAVHIIVDQAGALRRTISRDDMVKEILANVSPEATLLEPIYRLTTPEIPPNTIATIVPDALRPTLAPEYQGWRYIPYRETRARVRKILESAIGAEPEGRVGIAKALSGTLRGSAVLEGWGGSTALPTFKRTIEGVIADDSWIMLWDTSFGFECDPPEFLAHADQVLNMPDRREDRLYFGSSYSWFAVFHPGGQMRVGLLG